MLLFLIAVLPVFAQRPAPARVGVSVMERKLGLQEAIEMALKNNLVEIDYGWNDTAERRFTDRCPTGAIVWFDDRGRPLRGHAAKKILRHEPLPLRVD